jgi:hypothetical protein
LVGSLNQPVVTRSGMIFFLSSFRIWLTIIPDPPDLGKEKRGRVGN